MLVNNPINILLINSNIILYLLFHKILMDIDNITSIKSPIINRKIVHTPI